ncbi:hypothetical protein ETAA8_03720 [Anatilimnocola aggregata]|uniref:DUF72 domain-containing protein n=1 Tax=Anatilimnocola aggregata TaxID=2528021 RepID=A0A517Y4Y5_9BACT|nr:DUF72 domain-containing protein [Anatilimnocola aggregata]QDU25308.1 hypothetical protein ETAA8_03720 [Anatilimnocola aggregata]
MQSSVANSSTDIPHIGVAGWNIPAQFASHFASSGTHLEKYASQFSAVEINSSFYRLHRSQTYSRWAASVPDDFRFSVKVPKQITHELRLRNSEHATDVFLATVAGLGPKLGCLLVQLPPSLRFDAEVAEHFFRHLRQRCPASVACEPRNPSWFHTEAEELFQSANVGRVAADPAITSGAALPAGSAEVTYYRLHGSPRVYYSQYSADFLQSLSGALVARRNTWCIFDNTAEGWATWNALELQLLLQPQI